MLITSHRYTDFLVNEVTLDGKVVHLTDTDAPRRKPANKVRRKQDFLCYNSSLEANLFIQPSYRGSSPTVEATIKVEEPVANPAETVVQPVVLPNLSEDVSQVVSEGAMADGFTLKANDTALLDAYFGANIRTAVVKLYEKVLRSPQAKPGSLGFVCSEPITDRQLRGKLHQVITTP